MCRHNSHTNVSSWLCWRGQPVCRWPSRLAVIIVCKNSKVSWWFLLHVWMCGTQKCCVKMIGIQHHGIFLVEVWFFFSSFVSWRLQFLPSSGLSAMSLLPRCRQAPSVWPTQLHSLKLTMTWPRPTKVPLQPCWDHLTAQWLSMGPPSVLWVSAMWQRPLHPTLVSCLYNLQLSVHCSCLAIVQLRGKLLQPRCESGCRAQGVRHVVIQRTCQHLNSDSVLHNILIATGCIRCVASWEKIPLRCSAQWMCNDRHRLDSGSLSCYCSYWHGCACLDVDACTAHD